VRRMRAGLVGNLRHRVRYRCSLLHILGRLPLLLALAHNVGDQLALTCLGFERPALLTRDEARRIAVKMAKPPELLKGLQY
jgi:hypothetical protein